MASKGPRKVDGGFDVSQLPTHLMRRCIQRANDRFSRELGVSGLTKQQFLVLAAVEQNEGVSQTELVAKTGIDRSTLAEMIRRMTERGLLDRARTESDARANAVHLGAAGRKALRGAKAASDRVERAIMAGLPASERARFQRMLVTIVAHAEQEKDAGASGSRRRAHRRPR